MEEELQVKAFEIITYVGSARSCYIEAVQEAKKGDFEAAEKLMQTGQDDFVKGHHAHADLLEMESSGENVIISLLLLHAEDQLMSAESFKIVAEEFIDVYKKFQNGNSLE